MFSALPLEADIVQCSGVVRDRRILGAADVDICGKHWRDASWDKARRLSGGLSLPVDHYFRGCSVQHSLAMDAKWLPRWWSRSCACLRPHAASSHHCRLVSARRGPFPKKQTSQFYDPVGRRQNTGLIMINLGDLLSIIGGLAIGVLVINTVFYFLTPKEMRPDEFDPWDLK